MWKPRVPIFEVNHPLVESTRLAWHYARTQTRTIATTFSSPFNLFRLFSHTSHNYQRNKHRSV
jgi:hypothetical protein